MALEQAVSSSSSTLRNALTFPKTLIPKPQFQVSWRTTTQQQQRWKGVGGNLKCSMTTPAPAPPSYPKPAEIPWQKELRNSVNLIGNVAGPVEIKHHPSGKVVAWTRLYVWKNATQTSSVSLTFWDDLAHVASQHLRTGQQIHVSGRLITDTVETEEGKTQTYYKVVVQQLNFIERSFSKVAPSSQDQESHSGSGSRKVSNAANSTMSVAESWNEFFSNPGEWWDNRNKKRNPKAPDFKHKDSGDALWIEGRNNPKWVKSQLELMDNARMASLPAQNDRKPVSMVSAEQMLSF